MRETHVQRRHANNFLIRRFAYTCTAAMILLFVRCSSLDDIAGTGSQAGNGRISCAIYHEDGSPASGAAVYLRPNEYIADTSGAALGKIAFSGRNVRTDMNGSFSIDSVDTGIYCIEVNDGEENAVLLRCSVTKSNMRVILPNDTLHPTGSIRGAIASAPDFSGALYIQVYGLARVGVRDTATGGFVINDVPRGSYRIRILASSADYRPVEIENITMASSEPHDIGKIDFIHLSQWRYSMRLYLNTTPSGADVVGMVTGFPVLVRLGASTFDFGLAKADGSDVRFTKFDGESLPYDIERWDAVNQEAEIWVKADTVYGNDSSQCIVMYWGNATAVDSSNSAAVFDTADGYAGVWHMNENPSPGVPCMRDRTANAYNATAFGSFTSASSVDGPAGRALRFNGTDNYCNAGNITVGNTYSIGLWITVDTLGDYLRFITKDSSYTLWYDKDSVSVRMEHMPAGSWWRGLLQDGGTRIPMSTGTWYYFVGTFDGSVVRLFVNGIEASVSRPIAVAPRTNTKPVTIGQVGGRFSVRGVMDEIRIEGTARSADWIRLCYMNQRSDDKLILFK